jgi:ssDNA-binding Zn-finger/Zn-ribbon topoisomerase 1
MSSQPTVNGQRVLEVRYFAQMAPLIGPKQYDKLLRYYEATGKLPQRLMICGMAIDGSMNENKWLVPETELDKVAKGLENAVIKANHSDDVHDVIGKITRAWRENDKVFYEGEIADEDLIKKVLLGYIKYDSIELGSNDVYCLFCIKNKKVKAEEEAKLVNVDAPCPRCGRAELMIKNPTVLGLGIVTIPAYPNAEFAPIGFKASLNQRLSNIPQTSQPQPEVQAQSPSAPIVEQVLVPTTMKLINTISELNVFIASLTDAYRKRLAS